MKYIKIYSILLLSLSLLGGCKKEGNYPGGTVSPYISIFDVRSLYKGEDVALSKDKMFGSNKITGIVVSDHSGGNMPAGLLVLQDRRRLSELRGMSVNLGSEAAKYVPGDSVIINVEGGTLKRVDGILQITGLQPNAVTKVTSGNDIPVNRVPSNLILANPDKYESTLSVIVKAGFNPLPANGEVLSGDKILNDGFGDLTLHTEANTQMANTEAPFLANYYGITFNTVGPDKQLVPQFRVRTVNDIVVLSSIKEVIPIVISGFMADVAGGDGNYEYAQLLATQDINFATTPYSVVFTNNPNAAAPSGYPANGWATGGARTYKMNLTSGTVAKGQFFYVGGSNKLINGSGSTSISSSKWIRSFNYTTTNGDGFGTMIGGILANSGNATGIAVFTGTTVTATSKPIDVIFVGTSGSLYTPGPPPVGYRITNTDFYDIKNPITLEDQPFYRSGSNTLSFKYNTADLGIFNMLGGEYNPTLGRWVKARNQKNVQLTKTSTITEIEGEGSTILK